MAGHAVQVQQARVVGIGTMGRRDLTPEHPQLPAVRIGVIEGHGQEMVGEDESGVEVDHARNRAWMVPYLVNPNRL